MSRRPGVAIVGCGRLGGIIAAGLLNSGWQSSDVIVSDLTEEAAAVVARKLGATASPSNAQAAQNASVVVIAVKPKDVDDALKQIQPEVTKDHLVISVAAGKTTAWIEDRLPDRTVVVRAMPNVAASVGLSITAIAPGQAATKDHLTQAREIFEAIGETAVVEETAMDAITAVSGSGPAYVAYLAEAMTDAALRLGLDGALATKLVTATLAGTSKMLQSEDWPALNVRQAVTSPGGTTEAAIAKLDTADVKKIFSEAMAAAAARAKELSGG